MITSLAVLLSLRVGFASQNPVPVRLDSGRVRQFLVSASVDSIMPATSDWTLAGPVGDSAVLLADGSEWMRLSPIQASAFKRGAPGSTGSGWDNLRPTYDRLLEWGTVPSGIRFDAGMSNGRGTYSTSFLDWTARTEYRHAFTPYLSVAGGLAWEQTLFAVDMSGMLEDSAKPSGLGAMLGICGPFVCLELQRHAMPLTAESWLQTHLDSLVDTRQRGDFWTVARDSTFVSAWERRISIRVGVFGYRARWCPGLWAGPLQSIGLWDMPAGFLRMGVGLDWTRNRAATRGEVAIAPISWKVRTPGSEGVALELLPISLSIAYRRMGEFQMTVQSSIRFSDPFPPYVSRTPSR